MAKYRHDLPQRHGGIFLTDGGMETTLIFHEGIELPHFAAFVLLDSAEGRQHLKQYYASYLAVARDHGTGFVLDSPTWRANPDWAEKLGYSPAALAELPDAGDAKCFSDAGSGLDARHSAHAQAEAHIGCDRHVRE